MPGPAQGTENRGRLNRHETLNRIMPPAAQIRINDFVIKFANVNGSGSASANALFAKSILRMGVPVSPRNIFPSNIQGLPTWYEVRVSESGYLGRRGGVDLMVAMNPQTWDKDLAEIEPGGYLFYDSTRPLPDSKFRDDIHVVGMPLTEICNREYDDPRQRQLFKNIIYVGALSALIDLDPREVERLISEQYKGKEKLLEPNLKALHMGREYAANYLPSIGLKIKRAGAVGNKIFLEGNSAAALGCVYGGATVAAWYPITPSSSLAEAFSRHCRKYRHDPDTGKARYAIIQAEDELAAIGIVIGASWNGTRAFTCTSGPGISLMQEFIGLAYFAEIPAVIFDVQRGGPSTGMPTRTQQSDLVSCAYASHGDTKHVLLFPEDPKECFDLAAQAFDLAERLQTPVFVLMDLDIAMNERLCEPLAWDDARRYDRGKVTTSQELEAGVEFGRYLDVDGDGIAYRTYPGTHPTRGAFFTRGTTKDRYARYSEAGPDYVDNMQRLLRKFETAKELVPKPVLRRARQATRLGVIYFGSTSPAMHEALDALENDGVQLDALRVRAFPFQEEVYDFIADHEQVFVVEQNRDAQLRMLLVNEGAVDASRLISVLHYDGTPITARYIIGELAERVAVLKVMPLRRLVQ
jgi:2-oxoglutarate ferredoxin oxidoreductase subunit alpha